MIMNTDCIDFYEIPSDIVLFINYYTLGSFDYDCYRDNYETN